MIEEKSAGAIIFLKKAEGNKFLLLKYPAGHWDFVKGKIEFGENPTQTALRETKEETGITDLEFIRGFEEKIEYNFQFDGKLIHKQVLFFLAKTKTENITVSHEHLDFTWLNFSEALKKITYQNAKNVLVKAENYILSC